MLFRHSEHIQFSVTKGLAELHCREFPNQKSSSLTAGNPQIDGAVPENQPESRLELTSCTAPAAAADDDDDDGCLGVRMAAGGRGAHPASGARLAALLMAEVMRSLEEVAHLHETPKP